MFYEGLRLWEARFVVFYEGLRLWEAHLYVFYVSGRFSGVGCLTKLWNQVGSLKKDPHVRGERGRGRGRGRLSGGLGVKRRLTLLWVRVGPLKKDPHVRGGRGERGEVRSGAF